MGNIKPLNSVIKRLVASFMVGVSLVITVAIIQDREQNALIHTNQQYSEIINVSGRQRMLSQNIVKNALLFSTTDTANELYSARLDSLSEVFYSAHQKLKQINASLENQGSLPAPLATLFISLDTLVPSIFEATTVLNQTTASRLSAEALQELMVLESEFLPQMEETTNRYEQLAKQESTNIQANLKTANRMVMVAVVFAASMVLLITLVIIRRYARQLLITQKKLKATLQREETKVDSLQLLNRTIQVGIWTRTQGNERESWSHRLFQILGYPPEGPAEMPASFESLVHPDDLHLLQSSSNETEATDALQNVELRVKTEQGEYKWIEVSGATKQDKQGNTVEFIRGVMDIDERKQLDTQLKAFVRRAPAAIALFNPKIEYIVASQRWIEVYGLEGKTLVGQTHHELFPNTGDDWEVIHQEALNGEVRSCPRAISRMHDGTLQFLKWEVSPWYADENTVGGIIMMTEDITQSELQKEELRLAKEEAEEASKAKELFLATMSHEIRTPLNAINGIAQILLAEDPKPGQIENLELLRFSGENLLTIINDVLDISKIESGKLTLNVAPFDLYYIIHNIKRSLIYRAQESMVKLIADYDPTIPKVFVGDVTRISQILFNLMGNAIKFTKNGDVEVTVALKEKLEQDYILRIAVKDTGIGISRENQSRIFETFEQSDGDITREYGGTGLGLTICKRLLELMGSEIKLESELGKGSEFYFDLRLKPGNIKLPDQGKGILGRPNFEHLNLKILVVEDNSANQLIVKRFLSLAKIDYDLAVNGKEALELVKSQAYQMIFMDLQMPIMDGLTATRLIREMEGDYFQQVPIIALTADAFVDIQEKSKTVGMTDYLSKPFKPSELYAKISGNLEKNPSLPST
ncbi:MAG: ATP-binding protein [Bacteroidota bacterium]